MALISFMEPNSSATALNSQQRRCFAWRNSAPTLRGMKTPTQTKELRKAKVTEEHKKEAALLTELWEVRLHETQAVFGEKYDIGGQSAVGQFLRGEVPLSLKAARGFARGLNCQIGDFSPRLAKEAALFGLVSGDDSTDLTKVRRDEMQLILLFRQMHPDQKHDLLIEANNAINKNHPGAHGGNPFPNAPKPPKH